MSATDALAAALYWYAPLNKMARDKTEAVNAATRILEVLTAAGYTLIPTAEMAVSPTTNSSQTPDPLEWGKALLAGIAEAGWSLIPTVELDDRDRAIVALAGLVIEGHDMPDVAWLTAVIAAARQRVKG